MSAMEDKILWIGGTSSLTRTFVNCQLLNPKRLVLVGLESRAPDWIPPSSRYISFNLATATDEQARDLVQSIINDVSCIVIGVRPLLFAPYTQTDLPQRMLQGVEKLLEQACHQEASKLKLVLHVSSVAAMDHLRTQHFVSEAEDYPPIVEYKASYDKFKRLCEERITSIVDKANQGRNTAKILVCNFRISAIFSDETSCFQCTAINLQARVSCYVDHKIDCNSSVNVSRAMYAVMERASSNNQEGTNKKIQPVYYYTRPLSLKQPVAWGYYLQLFRRVHQMEYTSIWIPVWVLAWITGLVHWFAGTCNRWNLQLPYVEAMDYLLQVASREHSFDCSKFGDDFPNFHEQEETILECFVRLKEILAKERQKGYYQQSTPPASTGKEESNKSAALLSKKAPAQVQLACFTNPLSSLSSYTSQPDPSSSFAKQRNRNQDPPLVSVGGANPSTTQSTPLMSRHCLRHRSVVAPTRAQFSVA